MFDFLTRPMTQLESTAMAAVLAAVIILILFLGRRRSKAISQKFLAEHPDAATLYLYAEDLPKNDAEVRCQQGTCSKIFSAKDAPAGKIQKGAACHLVPGTVSFQGTILWTVNGYAARKHGRMGGSFTFEAAPGKAYALVFNTKNSTAHLTVLE